MSGDTPHVIRGLQTDYRRLLYNEFDHVLSVPITLQAGYGVVKQGTVISENLSASGNDGKHIPYNPTTIDSGGYQPGRAFLVSDIASGETACQVSMDDSYKFAVGDDLIVNDSAITAVNGGAITTIDRTTYSNKAEITFTDAITNGATVSNDAHACVEAGDSSNNYSDAVGILASSIDTGVGVNARGGNGPLMISNAIMYTGMTFNLDSAAQTDLSTSTRGKYTVLK